jgi:hypothetical protein
MSTSRETYLGDGLYTSFDGFMIMLHTSFDGFMIMLRAPREHGDHFVGLEPDVFAELLRFAKECGMPPYKK